jgi:hypothetical protein
MSKINLEVPDLAKTSFLKFTPKNVAVGIAAVAVLTVVGRQIQRFRGASVTLETN